MAEEVGASTEADLVEDSTAGAAAFMAAASGDITEAGVELAGTAAGAGTAGAAGVTQAGDADGVGVIPVGVGE